MGKMGEMGETQESGQVLNRHYHQSPNAILSRPPLQTILLSEAKGQNWRFSVFSMKKIVGVYCHYGKVCPESHQLLRIETQGTKSSSQLKLTLNKSFSRLETTCAFSQELEFLAGVGAY
jgi:hypothetical protein